MSSACIFLCYLWEKMFIVVLLKISIDPGKNVFFTKPCGIESVFLICKPEVILLHL